MILNIGTGSSGYSLIVTVTGTFSGASVTITNGEETFTKTVSSDGKASFNNLQTGSWTVTAKNNGISNSTNILIEENSAVTIALRYIPKYTYSGTSKLVDDRDTAISSQDSYVGNWKIRFLTSGTLKFTELNSAASGIDVFCVGGGSGSGGQDGRAGGGGGYTKTSRNQSVSANSNITVTIGAGGAKLLAGGTTKFGSISVYGGKARKSAYTYDGSDGGSGGGAGGGDGDVGGDGGSNGGNGTSGTTGRQGGTGQGSTTREFGESGKTLYAGGGAGRGNKSPGVGGAGGGGGHGTGGQANTGGGAGADGNSAGGSGIVIIRNKR